MDIKQLKELQCHLHSMKPEPVRLMTWKERMEKHDE
jgi:hypothetical protein